MEVGISELIFFLIAAKTAHLIHHFTNAASAFFLGVMGRKYFCKWFAQKIDLIWAS